MSRTTAPRLCLVEDDEIMGESLRDRFALEGFQVDWHRRGAAARQAIAQRRYDVVISDIRLPDLGGEALYALLRQGGTPLPPFVFITGFGSIERAVALLKAGAADYVTKPFDLDELVLKVHALADVHGGGAEAGVPTLGVSAAMQRIAALLPRVAAQARTVLITGESGVGKEHVAEQLHRIAAGGATQPFVALNCGAVTESLLEAELFGHERGAFTGAVRMRRGVFEQAHGGSLFLDEIGDMPLVMQVKLLRAIQERKVVRVGGEAPVEADARIIAATHHDLRGRVAAGQFREDLYYRINVVHLRIPPLRERREDILWFARRFLREVGARAGAAPRRLSGAAEQALLDYPWPGNLRELRHAIERACILWPDDTLEPAALFENDEHVASARARGGGSLDDYLRECERGYIVQALLRCDGHIGRTAAHLGISRKNLWEKMKRLAIEARAVDDGDDAAQGRAP